MKQAMKKKKSRSHSRSRSSSSGTDNDEDANESSNNKDKGEDKSDMKKWKNTYRCEFMASLMNDYILSKRTGFNQNKNISSLFFCITDLE